MKRLNPTLYPCLFVSFALLSLKLWSQGAYHDELHQIQNGMFLVGSVPRGALIFEGVPLLSMPYSSSMKGLIYGLLLRYFLGDFSIVSVRLLGISIYLVGFFSFNLLVSKVLPRRFLLVFNLLLLSDPAISLCVRHDWGPVALAAALRLVMLGFIIRFFFEKKNMYLFLVGILVSLSVYEKLNNVVLFLTVGLVFLFFKIYTVKKWLYCLSGVVVGSIPVATVNYISFVTNGVCVSFPGGLTKVYSFYDLTKTLKLFLFALYQQSSDFIFNMNSVYNYPDHDFLQDSINYSLCGCLVLAILLTGLVYYNANQPFSKFKPLFYISAASYGLIPILLYAFPAFVWVHHLIIGTPYQYLAISFLFADAFCDYRKRLNVVIIAMCAALFLANVYQYAGFVSNIYKEKASLRWSPSLNSFSTFSKSASAKTMFICTTWGLEWNIFCSNPAVFEISMETFWNYNKDVFLTSIKDKDVVYIVKQNIVKEDTVFSGVKLNNFHRVLNDLVSSGQFESSPLEGSLARLNDLTFLKFIRCNSEHGY